MNKFKLLILAVMLLLSASQVAAITLPNPECLTNRLSRSDNLYTNVSDFPENNSGPLEVNAKAEGWEDHDIKKAHDNIGKLHCPGTQDEKGRTKGGTVEAILIGSESQILTVEHAFIDEDGHPRDPLSKCTVKFPGHKGSDADTEYELALKDGKEGIRQLEEAGLLRLGKHRRGMELDYAVAPLKKAVPNVKAYKLSPLPFLHGCNDTSVHCKDLHMILFYLLRTKTPVSPGQMIFQTCHLFDVIDPKESQSTGLVSNCSSSDGTSGSVSFLKDDNGQLVRGTDGELVPVGILSGGARDKYNGQKYNFIDGIITYSVSLNSVVARAIKDVQSTTLDP